MVRIRKQNGELIEIPRQEAIEITDVNGALGVVIITDHRDTVRVLMPGDPLFNGYCRTQGMSAAAVHRHSSPAVRPAPTGA